MEIVDSYLAAFAAANPGSPLPKVEHERGWFRVTSDATTCHISNRVRKSKLIEMTARLLERVETFSE